MTEYRAYLIGEDDHFWDVVYLECADDETDLKQAELLVVDHDVELWQLDRKVGVLTKKPK